MAKPDSHKKDDFDLQEFLPFLLNMAAEEVSLEFQRIYKGRHGMLRTEWRVLFHLGNFGEMTAKEIGQRAKVHKTKISRAVQRLEQRRYLARTMGEYTTPAEVEDVIIMEIPVFIKAKQSKTSLKRQDVSYGIYEHIHQI